MEGQTLSGSIFENLIVIVILLNVGSFVLSTEEAIARSYQGLFDTIEIVTVIIFTIEYGFRFLSIPSAPGFKDTQKFGRLSWAFTDFFSIVDLVSIVPFYIDLFIQEDLPAMQFVRLIRLFRVMKADPRFTSAFSFFGVVYEENRKLLATGGLIGGIVWLIIASCYYLAERNNPSMVWEHPQCYNGLNSTDAGDDPSLPPCYNRFRSIPSAAYYTLLNLFGEFPLVDQHSNWGRVIAVFTAVVAVAVFAIPTGVFGAGFESMIARRKDAEAAAVDASAVAEDESPTARGGGGFDDDAWRTGLINLVASEKILFDKDSSIARRLANKTYVAVLASVIATNILLFMATTMQSMQGILFADEDGKRLALTGWAFSMFELLSLLLLCYDYMMRLISSPRTYLLSAYGIIDLGAVIPGLVSLCMFGFSGALTPGLIPTLLRALQFVRLLKLERYVRAFRIFTGIIQDNVDILLVSGFSAVVLMVFSSTFMYYSERTNPDPNISKYYTSIPNAMWISMLNLSGESPLADYSTCGKIVSGIVGVFAVGVFAIPVGLVGASFEDFVSDLGDNLQQEVQAAERKAIATELPFIKKCGWNWKLYAFLDGRTQSGRVFESFIAVLILATVMQAIIQTVPGVCAEAAAQEGCPLAMNVFETTAVAIFTVEYFSRLVASFQDPVMGSAQIPPLAYALSFYGLIDLLAIFPYYLALFSTRVDQVDEYFRLFRMFRLLKLDKFVPSISLIDDVFRAKRTGLLVSTFAAGIFWLFFSSALYLSEREDGAVKGCYTEAHRFSSVPSTLQYDLILLSGDYPLVDFTIWSRWLNVVQIFVAVGVVAVPSGLIASGFSELLEEQRNRKLARRQQAAIHLQRCIRGRLARKRFRETVEGAKALEREAKQLKLKREATRSDIERAQHLVFRFLGGHTFAGTRYRSFITGLIALNVVAVIIQSEPGLGGVAAATQTEMFFNIFEAFSIVVFSLDYVGRLFTSPVDGNYKSAFRYAFSFYGMIDLLSIAPWYIELILSQNGVPFDASSFRVLRFFSLLQLEIFTSALSQLDDVWRNSKSVLKATGLLAFMVWVAIATMFYLFERENKCVSDAFSSIPSSMYYVAIFLGGEWGQTDFDTIGGKLTCIFSVVLGIGLYGLPVGSIFESFSEVLAEQSETQQ